MKKLKFIFLLTLFFNSLLYSNIKEDDIKSILDKKYNPILIDKKTLQEYYIQNSFKPYWINENGLKDISITLLESIKNDLVLKPIVNEAFKLDEITNSLNSLKESSNNQTNNLIKIEFLLTELYEKYSIYLLKGSIDWKSFQEILKKLEEEKEIEAHWDRYDINKNHKKLLKKAVEQNDLSIALKELDPVFENYTKFSQAINEFETIAQNGDFIKLPPFKTLRVGDQSEIVKILRERLVQSKDLTKTCDNTVINAQNTVTNAISTNGTAVNEIKETNRNSTCEEVFDEDLKEAVISFQKRYGLFADGIVGLQTQRFLNTSAKYRIKQIRLNVERLRWLPRDFGEKYIIVNIPDYRLKMFENNEKRIDMAVVVGERKHPTPIFSDNISYIVLNPNWNIPESITKKELLPKLLKDPNYLTSKGIDIYEGWHKESEKVDTTKIIDALILEEEDVEQRFRFIQGPGEENPLGKIKFMFPNKHSVYMHDTNAKNLFANAQRAYSHGCIRLSKPDLLLSTIAQDDKNLNLEKINTILDEELEKDKSIGLNKKIPVHIVYLTAWIDEEGNLQFREDIYNYDSMQKELFF